MSLPHRPFALRVAGLPHDLEVTRARGRESLCDTFRFDLHAVTSRRVVAGGRALLGRAATLTLLDAQGRVRAVHGVVTAQRVSAHATAHELRVLRVRLEPRLALLRHRVRSRVFHDQSPAAIVAAVAREARVDVEGRLTRPQPRLAHCVQRAESDLDFLTRVLARHGLSWWFEHAPRAAADDDADDTRADLAGVTVAGDGDLGDSGLGRERLVLCDHPSGYAALGGSADAPTLRHGDPSDAAADVFDAAAVDRARPASARVARYTPSRYAPDAPALVTDAAALRDAGTTEAALGLAHDHVHAEHAPAVEPGAARALLEALRRDATAVTARTARVDLSPGARFVLADHPCPELEGPLVVTACAHRADVDVDGPRYVARLACAPADALVRPRPVAAPPCHGVESATVVGDVPGDVHVDDAGHVRVRFHWDARDATPDERSCRVRVASAWAGAHWGAQFTPRAGAEVLVAFLDGDPDQPVVVGALHNGHDAQPFPAGDTTRRSGLRTQSVGGDGHNELSFEDLHGREEVFVRAQRDLREEVGHDRRVRVRRDDHLRVGGALDASVSGVAHVALGHHPTSAVVEARGAVTVTAQNQARIESQASVVLQCGDAQLALFPDEVVLNLAESRIRMNADGIYLEAAKVFATGSSVVDLLAPRINLNSREGT